MDCYRITFIRFSGTEGDILLRLLTLSLHRALALGHLTAVFTSAFSVADKPRHPPTWLARRSCQKHWLEC
jgi:hypothetical protein